MLLLILCIAGRMLPKSLFAVIIYLMVVFFSGSRMAWICSFIMLIIFFAIGYKRAKNKRRMALIGTAVIVALLVISILNAATIVLEVVRDMDGYVWRQSIAKFRVRKIYYLESKP